MMQMLPRMAMNQTPDRALVNAEVFSDGCLLFATLDAFNDFQSLRFCQSCVTIVAALVVMALGFGASVFANAITHVVNATAEKQVIRIAAQTNVASMTDQFVIWNRSMRKDIGETVGAPLWFGPDNTVASMVHGSSPEPAFGW